MAEYLIKMADERGRVVQHLEVGGSPDEVRNRFLQQGYLVYSVNPRGVLAGGAIHLPQRQRIKLDQFVIFNQQFVTLIRAGLPILTALELLAKRQRNEYFRDMLDKVRALVKSGQLLSEAFEAQGTVPKIYTTTLMAGEKSGNLDEVLTRYVAFQRVNLSFRKKLLASLIYPAILVAAVILMFFFLIVKVVPQFAELYAQFDADLPAITKFTLAFGEGAQHYFFLILFLIAAAIAGFWYWKRTESGSEILDRIRFKVPIFGQVWLKYQIAMFSRMMSTLLAGGLPLVQALQTAGTSMSSRVIAQAVVQAGQSVREGLPLYAGLEQRKIFPDLAVEMIEVGESTGALPVMFSSVAEFYEEDVQNALAAALSLIEPVILVVMGVFVGAVLIALYLPIFSLGASGKIH